MSRTRFFHLTPLPLLQLLAALAIVAAPARVTAATHVIDFGTVSGRFTHQWSDATGYYDDGQPRDADESGAVTKSILYNTVIYSFDVDTADLAPGVHEIGRAQASGDHSMNGFGRDPLFIFQITVAAPAETWTWVDYEGPWSEWSEWSPRWDPTTHTVDESGDQTRSRTRMLYRKEVSSLGRERGLDTLRTPPAETQTEHRRLWGTLGRPVEQWSWLAYEGPWSAWSAWTPDWDPTRHYQEESQGQTRSRSRPLFQKEVSTFGGERSLDTPREPATEVQTESRRLSGTLTRSRGQTLTFPNPSPVQTNATVTLTATASSGLPVTYTLVTGSGSISGATLRTGAAGAVRVTATQAGNATYDPAVPVTIDIVVSTPPSATVRTRGVSVTTSNDDSKGPGQLIINQP